MSALAMLATDRIKPGLHVLPYTTTTLGIRGTRVEKPTAKVVASWSYLTHESRLRIMRDARRTTTKARARFVRLGRDQDIGGARIDARIIDFVRSHWGPVKFARSTVDFHHEGIGPAPIVYAYARGTVVALIAPFAGFVPGKVAK